MRMRKLTIEKLVKPSFSYQSIKIFSQIRLKGKWLTEMGFIPGEKVNVMIEKNRLIIERSQS